MKLERLIPLSAATLGLIAGTAFAFDLTSPDLKAGEQVLQKFVFNSFGCTGENVSPSFMWKNAPSGTKSFAIFALDPDAKTGGAGFWHWVVVDIPGTETGLVQGAGAKDGIALPKGARQLATDFGYAGWGGPCPPQTDAAHRYDFTVYALGVEKLDIPDTATASFAGFMANANALGSATFEAVYDR
jgi:Raf kinase inhibitor-like YbhB/YbcL family protein